MTVDEALEMLRNAPRETKPSKVNRSLTQKQVVEIVENAIMDMKEKGITKLDSISEKRVYQVYFNKKRI